VHRSTQRSIQPGREAQRRAPGPRAGRQPARRSVNPHAKPGVCTETRPARGLPGHRSIQRSIQARARGHGGPRAPGPNRRREPGRAQCNQHASRSASKRGLHEALQAVGPYSAAYRPARGPGGPRAPGPPARGRAVPTTRTQADLHLSEPARGLPGIGPYSAAFCSGRDGPAMPQSPGLPQATGPGHRRAQPAPKPELHRDEACSLRTAGHTATQRSSTAGQP